MSRLCLIAVMPLAVVAAAGCGPSANPSDPYYRTVAADPHRDTDLARSRNRRGKALLADEDYAAAETILKQALDADPFCGPAHNNLGIAYLKQDKLYLAAWEFQYAIKLMPAKPEPRGNLGLVMEQAGRFAEAETHYEKAMAAAPDNPEYIANLARCRIRLRRRTPETADLLRQLILKDTRPEWTAWARAELSRMPKDSLRPPTAPEPPPTSQPAPQLEALDPQPANGPKEGSKRVPEIP